MLSPVHLCSERPTSRAKRVLIKEKTKKKQEGHNICEFRVEEDTPLERGVFEGGGERELALSPRGLAFSLCQVSFGFMALFSVLCSPDLFAMLTCLLLGERERE